MVIFECVLIVCCGKAIATAAIVSLQRDKKVMKEIATGFECAFICDGFHDWQIDDIAECSIEVSEE